MFSTAETRFLALLPILTALFALPAHAATTTTEDGITITQQTDRLRIEINGKLFTEYFFKDVPRPYYYPLIGPGEKPMTRNWPMKVVQDEEQDHKHHRSLWFTHGSVNGHDFWSEDKKFGKIVHDGFTEVSSGKEQAVIRSKNSWIANDGAVICKDVRTFRIYRPQNPSERVFDFEITIFANSDSELVFGDTKEGSMAVRLTETMRLKGKTGAGHIVNSAGIRDDQTWGKKAEWCDYYGPVDGKIVGVAIFDHPKNPRHPTWWHVRDYGLFAANPFGKHDFEKLTDKTAGDLKVPAGGSVTFRYRFYLHEGDEKQSEVAKKFTEYTQGIPGK